MKIHTGSQRIAFMWVMFSLALCALIGGIALIAAASYRETNLLPRAGLGASGALAAQQATYRYTSRVNGTTLVQRSSDGGRTWAHGGVVPEPVLQLAPSPGDDTVVFARTGMNLWRSETAGASWGRIASLPGRPLALAVTGNSDSTGLVFLGTDTQGLYTSLDGGRTWQAAGGRLSLVGAGALAVSALAVSPGDDQVVYVAATFSMATPTGLHSIPLAFIGVDDGRRWFEVIGAGPVRLAPILAPGARTATPTPLAALPGAIADIPAGYWILAAMAALLVLMGTLIGKGPRRASHLGLYGRNPL